MNVKLYNLLHDLFINLSNFFLKLSDLFIVEPVEDPIPDPDPGISQDNGISVSGLQYAETKVPGIPFKDYISNSKQTYDDLKAKGFDIFRLPYLNSRLYNGLTFVDEYLQFIKDNISHAGRVWLDPHNFPTNELENNFIQKRVMLVEEFKDDDRVECIELDNEPHDLTSKEVWYNVCRNAVIAMKEAGWNKLIGIPIYHWSSMDDFFSVHGSNWIPPYISDDVIYVFHNYFNKGNTGYNHPLLPDEPAELHVERLRKVIEWAKKHKVKIAITEYGVPLKQEWVDNMKPFIQEIKANKDTVVAFFYWSAGEWYTSETVFDDIHIQAIFN